MTKMDRACFNRLLDEQKTLADRISKLSKVIDDTRFKVGADFDDEYLMFGTTPAGLLKRQLKAMESYNEILIMRIGIATVTGVDD